MGRIRHRSNPGRRPLRKGELAYLKEYYPGTYQDYLRKAKRKETNKATLRELALSDPRLTKKQKSSVLRSLSPKRKNRFNPDSPFSWNGF